MVHNLEMSNLVYIDGLAEKRGIQKEEYFWDWQIIIVVMEDCNEQTTKNYSRNGLKVCMKHDTIFLLRFIMAQKLLYLELDTNLFTLSSWMDNNLEWGKILCSPLYDKSGFGEVFSGALLKFKCTKQMRKCTKFSHLPKWAHAADVRICSAFSLPMFMQNCIHIG